VIPTKRARARSLFFVLLGIVLVRVGCYHWHLVLVSSADVGRTYLREDRGAARRGRVAGDRRRLLEGRGVT